MANVNKKAIECKSLFGKPLYAIDYPAEVEARYLKNLAAAGERYRQSPDDEDAIVWYGRRLGYLTRYQEAIAVYSDGLKKYPDSFVLLRHRGHRYISIREFTKAIDDLEKASQLCLGIPDSLEIDGEPNKSGIPTSTVRFNIYYHLALAWYLRGQFEKALSFYQECMVYSRDNDDSLVATTDWLYMTLMRLGRTTEAARMLEPISAAMNILENAAYHHRLLLYKGLKQPEDLLGAESTSHHDTATHGYGIGNWYLYNGNIPNARETFERVLATSFWPAFGFIAAEADMKRGLSPA